MPTNFEEFFSNAIGNNISPYPYQLKLSAEQWPEILKIPTGMGKTASIILSWLYKRAIQDKSTPRRLVYCLPMRVLVEQTAKNAKTWIKNLITSNNIISMDKPKVYILKGGEIDNDWDRYPEHDAIIIGTQDQLLSRALNRGYAMSRFRWPIDFGYLNNDCLWIMDEIQLMGTGLATTAQLQAFREMLGTIHPVKSVWMSATLQREWLHTVDLKDKAQGFTQIELSPQDLAEPSVINRIQARKPIKKAICDASMPAEIAKLVLENHQQDSRTMVVVNTVKRAVAVYKAIKSKKPKASLTLIHSRFRPIDRKKALDRLLSEPEKDGVICVSTQVIEAGVDVSATTLITDLAPWASMVQRFGRCNREGNDEAAQVFLLDLDLDKKGASLPYLDSELKEALAILEELTDVAPSNLPAITLKANFTHVIRKNDLIDLFDTTPDLTGMDIDISRFIRESEDHDVQVFWRDISGQPKDTDVGAPQHDELCSVSINNIRAINGLQMFAWDHLEKKWGLRTSVNPGMMLFLPVSEGCYDAEFGWTGDKKDIPELIEPISIELEANDDDTLSLVEWQTLSEHTKLVIQEIKAIIDNCNLSNEDYKTALFEAAIWHDVGKSHEIFQSAIIDGAANIKSNEIWAKGQLKAIRYRRQGFRHELASALAMLKNSIPDLPAYLAAAHHGKVRLSIRSLPTECPPNEPDKRFARGIWEGDELPCIELVDGVRMPSTTLDLSFMEFGDGPNGPSWIERMLALRDDLEMGPFRLAYLEGVLRSADWRASAKTRKSDE